MPRFRADAAALFSLIRNIGSSVGISIVVEPARAQRVINRAELVIQADRGEPEPRRARGRRAGPHATLAQLNAQVQAQAAFIAYIDDFKLMMFMTLAVIPLLVFMRTPKAAPAAEPAVAME